MISTEEDLDDSEAAACVVVHERLQGLLHGKALSYAVPMGGRVPAGVVTPAAVRAMIQQAVGHLPRADALAAFIVRRVDVNGLRFEEWEADPSRIRATP